MYIQCKPLLVNNKVYKGKKLLDEGGLLSTIGADYFFGEDLIFMDSFG